MVYLLQALVELNIEHINWQLKHAFNLSIHKRRQTPAVLLYLEHNGITGVGEIALPPYLKPTQSQVTSCLSALALEKINLSNWTAFQKSLAAISSELKDNLAALSGIDMALHHLYCQLHQTTVSALYNLPINTSKCTSFTITPDKESILVEKLDMAVPFKILKVKLGSQNDQAFISLLRKYTDKPFFVDVNQGWKSVSEAIELAQFLADQNVLLIEQPFEKTNLDWHQKLKEKISIPIIADESFHAKEDLPTVSSAFDGINIKLSKCGGIAKAYDLIVAAKKYNLKLMLGCMTSSTLAIQAANHFSSCCDFIDLDGAFLIQNDPFYGLKLKDGVLDASNVFI